MKDRYLILTYSEHPDRPSKLFCKHTEGAERKNVDGTKFVVHCDHEDCECLDWVQGAPVFLTHSEVTTELIKSAWNY